MQVAPILERHCIRCHSTNNSKGDFSLSQAETAFADEYIVAGKPQDSHLIEVITSSAVGDPPRMPQNAEPLSADEVQILTDWIAAGAVWPEGRELIERSRADGSFWSLQPITTPDEASVETNLGHATIDAIVSRRLADAGLQRNQQADRRTLIRRATYDLTGLPPTPDEIQRFLADDSPQAWEKLIDRLLSSPHYGERWGRHWLDVVRFGESIGYERNVIVNNIWPFRDYVIRSINADKPFNQLIREHLAGDVIASDDPGTTIGTAFLVAGPYDDVGNQDAAQAAQIRANTLDEIIRATSEAFLGLTVGCSRCHNHKFDPITQGDYYSLYATFSGVRHGSVEWTTESDRSERAATLQPLTQTKAEREARRSELRNIILARGRSRLDTYNSRWHRPAVDRTGTEEVFDAVLARYVRLVCEAQDINPNAAAGFGIDEFEVWSTPMLENGLKTESVNVALTSNGGRATGASRRIEDFAGAYGPELTIDGKTGARFIAASPMLTIELARPTSVHRVIFSSARNQPTPEHGLYRFVAEYRIEVSTDGKSWKEVANGNDRQPVNQSGHLDRRLLLLEATTAEKADLANLQKQIGDITKKIAAVPSLPTAWIGRRVASDAAGPFHIFQGGDPQKRGKKIHPSSLSILNPIRQRRTGLTEADLTSGEFYELEAAAPESERRLALANWIVNPRNPLTPRVLANRIWHYHFGMGIVDTPSDFGFMGGRPSHPELLDYLATQLVAQDWRLKPLHRMIMLSDTYRQSADYQPKAARTDADSRLLWRFPPRRLSAEEIRDTMLDIAGKLSRKPDQGPGFRLYEFLQDNVCTYRPLDQHGPETYRRAVYHQNARASVVDLMTEFDQPDCTFGAPRRAATTTPLQALTMLNHSFTVDMAAAMAERLKQEAGDSIQTQVNLVHELCFGRTPSDEERNTCIAFVKSEGLPALCRVLLNTTELITVR